jgi:glycosyltransferase involved in cell wall biosynthesis
MSLIEAAACGRPIIATDVPGCREIVEHEKNGLLVPVKDPKALADAICRLINNPGLRSQMGQESRKLVEEEFAESVVVTQTLDLYQSMLGKQWVAAS